MGDGATARSFSWISRGRRGELTSKAICRFENLRMDIIAKKVGTVTYGDATNILLKAIGANKWLRRFMLCPFGGSLPSNRHEYTLSVHNLQSYHRI